MTTKSSKSSVAKPSAAKPPTGYRNQAVTVQVTSADEKEFATAIARKLTRPDVSSAGVIEAWQKDTHDINELVSELSRQVAAVNDGDLQRAEGLLISQAHALDNIFANLARRAVNQQYLKQWDTYMRMAMKAQNQCRMTLETLAALKNPPTVFARQANINNGGQQQVNNGVTADASRARESEFQQSELLEANDGERVDAGAQSSTSGVDQELAALGAVDRATNG